jgi:hypothetical protein
MAVLFKRQDPYITRGIDGRFKVDENGSKVFRTAEDKYNEQVVKDFIEKRMGVSLFEVGDKFCKIDWQVRKNNKVVGFVESKVKQIGEHQFSDYFLSQSKLNALLDASFIWRVPSVFVWGLVDPRNKNDAIRSLRVDTFDFSKVVLEIDGTRRRVKSKYDQELIYKIPVSLTNKLC